MVLSPPPHFLVTGSSVSPLFFQPSDFVTSDQCNQLEVNAVIFLHGFVFNGICFLLTQAVIIHRHSFILSEDMCGLQGFLSVWYLVSLFFMEVQESVSFWWVCLLHSSRCYVDLCWWVFSSIHICYFTFSKIIWTHMQHNLQHKKWKKKKKRSCQSWVSPQKPSSVSLLWSVKRQLLKVK